VLDAKQIASIDPGIRIEAVGGVHYVADCHFSPAVFMRALSRKLSEMKVQFVRARAQRLDVHEGRIEKLETQGEQIGADEFVLAAGAWSSRLAAQVGVRLPLQAGKGYSFEVPNPPERPTICAILMEGRVAVTPMPEGVRFGGTMEIGPADDGVDARRVQGIREAVPHYYPAFRGFDLSASPPSLGLRPCTPDGLPYIGRSTRYPNLVIATGHAMMGMSLGPITGQIVGDIVANRPGAIPLDLLRPERFA
jgi:D-amino-acid dehydrogenase